MSETLLNADKILDKSAKKYGLENYVSDGIRRRFHMLISSFNDNGVIEAWALPAALSQFSKLIKTRLELERDWSLHPAIEQEQIKQPFFVVGTGRTGSTLMQTLLSLGDGCRSPLAWECRQPSPPPGFDIASEPARIAAENKYMLELLNIAPGLLLSHPYYDAGAFATVEDEELFVLDFHTPCPTQFTRVPTLPLVHSRKETGLIDALRFHKKMLQQFQWKTPTEHWVCKTTQHFFQMPTTWEVYPDAICVWSHRDPVNFIGALLGVLQHLYTPITGKFFRGEAAAQIVDATLAGYDAVLQSDWLDDERIVHVNFESFVHDQIGVIREVYQRNNLDFSPAYEQRMRDWLSDPKNKSSRHGKFLYSLEQFGLNSEEIKEKFDAYYKRFLS